jgi:hypothetical protein
MITEISLANNWKRIARTVDSSRGADIGPYNDVDWATRVAQAIPERYEHSADCAETTRDLFLRFTYAVDKKGDLSASIQLKKIIQTHKNMIADTEMVWFESEADLSDNIRENTTLLKCMPVQSLPQ